MTLGNFPRDLRLEPGLSVDSLAFAGDKCVISQRVLKREYHCLNYPSPKLDSKRRSQTIADTSMHFLEHTSSESVRLFATMMTLAESGAGQSELGY